MMRSLKIVMAVSILSLFVWNCSSNTPSTQVDQKLKTLFENNDKFQKMAIKKIKALDKDVATLKKNQSKLGKQIPVIVKQIKILKRAVAASGKGVTPEMKAQLDSILINMEALELELAQVKEMGPVEMILDTPEEKVPPILIKGSDQERIYRQYGEPLERYIMNNNQVWLYDNGVAVFDMNGRIVSIEFK